MNPLSARTERLLELARENSPPPAEARERVERSLARRIALGAGVVSTGAAVTHSAAGAGAGAAVAKPLAVAALGAVMAAAGWRAADWVVARDPATGAAASAPGSRRAAPAPKPGVAAAPPAETVATIAAPQPEPEVAVRAPRSPSPNREQRAPVELGAADALREETEALKLAQQALRDGDTGRALTLLAEQDARYPGGLLQEERAAARVLGLCQRGLGDQARAAAQRFERRFPRSPLLARVRSSCQSP
jgi:hypothetical protein